MPSTQIDSILASIGIPADACACLLDLVWPIAISVASAAKAFVFGINGAGDRLPIPEWPLAKGRVDIVLFEGWCVGAKPLPESDLVEPMNARERDDDPQSREYGDGVL